MHPGVAAWAFLKTREEIRKGLPSNPERLNELIYFNGEEVAARNEMGIVLRVKNWEIHLSNWEVE